MSDIDSSVENSIITPDWTFEELVEAALETAVSKESQFQRDIAQWRRGWLRHFPVQLIIVERASFPSLPSDDDYKLSFQSDNPFQGDYIPVSTDLFWYSKDASLKEFDCLSYNSLMDDIEECNGWSTSVGLTKLRFHFEENYQYVVIYRTSAKIEYTKVTRCRVVRGNDGKVCFQLLTVIQDLSSYFKGVTMSWRRSTYEWVPSLFAED